MSTNTNDHVREVVRTGLDSAAVSTREVFVGIDAADLRQVVTLIAAGESPKPAIGMTKDTLLKRVAQLLKTGFRVHCVYEAGPTGLALARDLIALGADCIVVRARTLERHGRRRKNDKRNSRRRKLRRTRPTIDAGLRPVHFSALSSPDSTPAITASRQTQSA